jgi:hypothetical protein
MLQRLPPAKCSLSAALAFLLVLAGVAPLEAAPAQQTSTLKILVLEGQDAINNIRQRTARDTIVEVQDENNKPVAGAVVTFLLPDRGASRDRRRLTPSSLSGQQLRHRPRSSSGIRAAMPWPISRSQSP